jgi:hypothetical protein
MDARVWLIAFHTETDTLVSSTDMKDSQGFTGKEAYASQSSDLRDEALGRGPCGAAAGPLAVVCAEDRGLDLRVRTLAESRFPVGGFEKFGNFEMFEKLREFLRPWRGEMAHGKLTVKSALAAAQVDTPPTPFVSQTREEAHQARDFWQSRLEALHCSSQPCLGLAKKVALGFIGATVPGPCVVHTLVQVLYFSALPSLSESKV